MARNTKAKKPSKKQPQAKSGGIGGWWRNTKGELRKVSWPTSKEAQSLTVVVVIVMVIMAMFLGGMDYLFYRFFELIWAL